MRGFFKRFLPLLACLMLLNQAAFAYTTLEKGDRGTEVTALQQALSALGYSVGADGSFGAQTRNAVKAFQADHGLKVDGKAGDQTLTLLYALAAQQGQAAASFVTGAPAVTAAPAVVPATAMNTAQVYCNDGGKLNLRTGAGTGYKSIEKIPSGSTVLVLEQGSKWCCVQYNGQTGYVMTSFLRFGASATAAPAAVIPAAPAAVVTAAPAAQPGAVQAIVTCADGGKLNLRQAPSSGSKVLARIPNGTALQVQPAGGKWYAASYNGEAGFVQSGFLEISASAGTAQQATAAPAVIVTAAPAAPAGNAQYNATVVCADGGKLNLRKTAAASGKVLDRIPSGTPVNAQPVDSKWSAVSYNGQAGYVMTKYLQYTGSAAGQATASPAGTSAGSTQPAGITVNELQFEEFRYALVNTASGSLNIRKGPGSTYGKVSEIRNGTQVVITAISGEWCALYYGDIQGYAQRQYLSIQAAGSTGTVSGGGSASGSYATYVIDYNGNTSSAKTAAVRRAQQALRALNYNVPLTGAFEARTHDALVAFQLRNGLTASGVLDSATQAMLYSGSAHDVAWPASYYLPSSAGRSVGAPGNVQLLHWYNDVTKALGGNQSVTIYEPATGLSWKLKILSRGHHLDAEPATLEDTMLQKKAFGGTSWDIHPVYVQLPDGRWTLATMHNYPHGTNTVMNNGFGGQNCVHFLRDMSEAQRNDPKYGVQNQEKLRDAWYALSGVRVTQ